MCENKMEAPCRMACENGGICRHGSIGGALLGQFSNNNAAGSGSNSHLLEHCECPTGYAGQHCEIQVEECGTNGEHMCLHGSKCVQDGQGNWTCDCQTAFTTDSNYAGPFCQHHHTSICTTSGGTSAAYQGPSSFAFCINDGVCIDIVENGQR